MSYIVKNQPSTEGGKNHDKKLAAESELTPPVDTTLVKDKGFEGFEIPDACHGQPQNKPRRGELTDLEKNLHRVISPIRIVVEHVIAGIKRCRIVRDIFRNTSAGFDNWVMVLACGLHNSCVISVFITEMLFNSSFPYIIFGVLLFSHNVYY
ncbi:MAG: transposase family protein [Thioploca sp.]|nr:transposase family protein [Thioploca sp.]